jgi:hypothetical protein
MKQYIGLLALCVLSSMSMEQEAPVAQEDQVTLVAADGGTIVVSRDIAEKMPAVTGFIDAKERVGREKEAIRVFGDVVGPEEAEVFESMKSLQSVVNIVKEVYTNAPVLQKQYDPQFFEETDEHRAYTPADIPEQVRNIVNEQRGDIDQNVLLQAADYLGIDWMGHAVKNQNSKSIADLVVCDELPKVTQFRGETVLNLSDYDLVSLAGMNLINERMLQNIVILNLTDNSICGIEQGVFAELYNLKELYLQNNDIHYISSKDFEGLRNLVVLELNDNLLKRIPQGAFEKLRSLESLDLSVNQINEIHQDGFTRLQNLQNLWLNNNEIRNVSQDVFADLQNIEVLNIRNNNLNVTREQILQQLPEDVREMVEIKQ